MMEGDHLLLGEMRHELDVEASTNMFKQLKIEVPWETGPLGEPAVVHSSDGDALRLNAASRKYILYRALTDVCLVSTEFQGEVHLYYPRAWVFLEKPDTATFLGIYECTSSESDSDDDTTQQSESPHAPFCIRIGEWMRSTRISDAPAHTPMEFIAQNGYAISSRVFFANAADCDSIRKLIADGKDCFVPPTSLPSGWVPEELSEIEGNLLRTYHWESGNESFQISLGSESELIGWDQWAARFIKHLRQSDDSKGSIPDADARIRYSYLSGSQTAGPSIVSFLQREH